MNVTLIGMSGSGKSHMGRLLAERLELKFLDIDRDLWEVKYGKSIQEILDERGEEWYLAEEERLIIEGTKDKDDIVISPPGSVAYLPDTLAHLKIISTIIYLKVPFETIEERNRNSIPHAVIGLGRKTLRELYEERTPMYEKYADFMIETDSLSEEESVKAIEDFLRSKK